jgi:hypothetical protein
LWHRAVFGDPTLADAIRDRIIHRAHRIDLKAPRCAATSSPAKAPRHEGNGTTTKRDCHDCQ